MVSRMASGVRGQPSDTGQPWPGPGSIFHSTRVQVRSSPAASYLLHALTLLKSPNPRLLLAHHSCDSGVLFTDTDRAAKRIRDGIAPHVAADEAYKNAKENTPHTARMAHDQALAKVMQHLLKDDTQVCKQFVENESFKRLVGDMVYALTSL